MNYLDIKYLIEKRFAIEAHYYFCNQEKLKLESLKTENSYKKNNKIIVNLLNFKSMYSLIFISSTILFSFAFELFYKKNKNYYKIIEKSAVRLLILNSIYYICFTDYWMFYETVYIKFCLGN
jgi:hypothetical protein